jgi:hypothetical protein
MPLKLNSSGGGSVTLDTPSTASTYTLTVPAITGTAVVTGSTGTVSQGMLASGVAGNGPTFSAYQSSTQNVSNGVATKIQFQTELFDTANCFDSTTNYRFTPNVAGYYQVTAGWVGTTTAATLMTGYVYKNGSLTYNMGNFYISTSGSHGSNGSWLIYMNGSTDYIEFYGYQTGTVTMATAAAANGTYFQAALVRAA